MRVTAYCPCEKCCGRWADGVTASGEPVTANGGRFAAADRSIPFGTMIEIPGYNGGRAVPVLDRGGAIRGDRLDVFFPTHEQALRWGVRHIDVTMRATGLSGSEASVTTSTGQRVCEADRGRRPKAGAASSLQHPAYDETEVDLGGGGEPRTSACVATIRPARSIWEI